jgi:uncharacterized protein (DUF1501 family)
MTSRRDFLKMSALASASVFVPRFLQLGLGSGFEGKRLVIIQLSGGNDGLNTMIPFRNDIYYRERPRLAIKPEEVLKLNDEIGLHPALNGLKKLYDQGELAILNGVGYPDPVRSHFRSMDIWHTASDADTFSEEGWLGKWAQDQNKTIPAIELSDTLSLAMKADEGNAIAISNYNQFTRTANDRLLRAVSQSAHNHEDEMASYLYQTARRVTEGADYLTEKIGILQPSKSYPTNALGKDLALTASLIKSGCETQVYYASIGGFDTHANQSGAHARLLGGVSEALTVFAEDLKGANLWKDTLVMVFSEFGRRVKQNASGGTDHGTASNVWLLGGGLKQPGIRNEMPSLEDLDKGDLKYNTDFRSIYAGILKNWLEADVGKIIRGNHPPLEI